MFQFEQQTNSQFRRAHYSHLRHLALIAIVVESGSFTIAGRRLGMGKSSVSRLISELENFVGARLLNRTTRSLTLTEAGERVIGNCSQLVEAATQAFNSLDPNLPLSGKIRIACSVGYGHFVLVDSMKVFMGLNPDVDFDLRLSDNFLDLVEHGIDLAIRVGSAGPSPQYISRKVGVFRYRLFGHRALLDKYGPIDRPEQAQDVPWLLSPQGSTPTLWTFTRNGKTTQINVTGRVTINSLVTRFDAAKSAQGVIGVPDFVSDDALGESLEQLLPDYKIEPEIPIFAVYPNSKFLSPRVADFVAHLSTKTRMKPD